MRIVEVYKEIQEQEMNIVSSTKDLITQLSRKLRHDACIACGGIFIRIHLATYRDDQACRIIIFNCRSG